MPPRGSDIGYRVTRRGPPTPGAPAPQDAGTPVQLPGIFIPPPGALYFTVQAELDIAGAQDTAFANAFPVPDNHRAAVNTVQFFATVADATLAGFTFALTIGGNPVPGFNALTIPQVGGAQSINCSPIYLPVPNTTNIGASFHAPNANPHHVGVFIQGWFWPTTDGA